MLDRHGGQMRIGREISSGASGQEQFSHESKMARAGVNHSDQRLFQPGLDDFECRFCGQWIPEQAWPRGDTKERKKHVPGESDTFLSGDSGFQPAFRLLVLWSVDVDGVNEDIDVQQYHLRSESLRPSSSSSMASAAARALSQRKYCSAPSGNDFCTKGPRPRRIPLVNPVRTASFKACLNETPRSRMALRSRRSASASRVTVVLIYRHHSIRVVAVMMPCTLRLASREHGGNGYCPRAPRALNEGLVE